MYQKTNRKFANGTFAKIFIITALQCTIVLIVVGWLAPISETVELKDSEDQQFKAKLWPKPRHQVQSNRTFQVKGRIPGFIVTGEKCSLLEEVILKTMFDLKRLIKDSSEENDNNEFEEIGPLELNLLKPCEDYPYLGMNESYQLTISKKSILESASIWGIIRGLETYVQLFDRFKSNVIIRETQIIDYPNYEHRGLLLDTGRLFVPVDIIQTIIDGLAMNKMNVFHWHIYDNIYCPIQSEVYPNMTMFEKNKYTKEDIKSVIEFARVRGVRVVPEIDVPGHGSALQKVFPSIFLPCNHIDTPQVMNPTLNATYKFLKEFLGEINWWFPDEFVHLGGDEAHPECWQANDDVASFMKERDMSLVDLQTMFYERLVEQLDPKTKRIFWQDVFDYKIKLSTEDVVQVWNYNPEHKMVELLNAGYQVLYSSFWYLNYKPEEYDFDNYYRQDPRVAVKDKMSDVTQLKKILGGETCLWTNYIHDSDEVLKWIFPKTCAVGEVLWSETDGKGMTDDSRARIAEQKMRMRRRGIST